MTTESNGRKLRLLSREEIAKTALGIIETSGLEGLSMRVLARELNVWPTAIYHHVRDKEQLLVLVCDLVFEDVEFPGDVSDWAVQLRQFSVAIHAALDPYPGLAAFLLARPELTPGTLHLVDECIGVLLGAGFDRAAAVRAFAVVHLYVLGAMSVTSVAAKGRRPGSKATSGLVRRKALTTGHYPSLNEVAREITSMRLEDQFVYGLDRIIAGLNLELDHARMADRESRTK